MSSPLNNEERLVAMYDSFVKTVMRNKCKDIRKARKYQQKHEIVGTENNQNMIDQQMHFDIYPSEHSSVGHDRCAYVITDEHLFCAIMHLPTQYRDVLILEFWLGWTDQQIAEHYHVVKRTVYNWRQKAFRDIRSYYEGDTKWKSH